MTPVLPSVLYRLIAVLCSILLFTRSCAGVRAHFSYAHIRDTLLRVFLIISAIPLCLFSPKGHRYPCGRNDRKRLPGGRSVFSDPDRG